MKVGRDETQRATTVQPSENSSSSAEMTHKEVIETGHALDESQPTEDNVELPFLEVPEVLQLPIEDLQQTRMNSKEPKKASNGLGILTKDDLLPIVHEEKSYKLKSDLELDGKAAEVVADILEEDFSIKKKDLLAISPAAREELIKLLTKRRVPIRANEKQRSVSIEETEDKDENPFLKAARIKQGVITTTKSSGERRVNFEELPSVKVFSISVNRENGLSAGSIVIPDRIEQYLNTLPWEQQPKRVVVPAVAKASEELRSVLPEINGQTEVETLYDNGSQIVSMSSRKARELGLAYDPDYSIDLESANGQITPTLGLARNVPYRFNDVTLHMQVHILDTSAYDSLLGKPFEVVTASVVRTSSDGEQWITITCPNTGKKCVIPTYPRGRVPGPSARAEKQKALEEVAGFRTSMS